MRVVIGRGDRAIVDALLPAFVDDTVTVVELDTLGEPDAFTTVDSVGAEAVVLVPDWSRPDHDELRGCWWLARAAELARIPLVLRSTAEVFDGRDRRPRTEFDRPGPITTAGRLADAAEQLMQWTTRAVVVLRTGPLDRGGGSLAAIVRDPEGVVGGADAVVTPGDVRVLGRQLRALAVAHRYGVWHLAAPGETLGALSARHGWDSPRPGRTPAPAPLTSTMTAMAADTWLPRHADDDRSTA